MVDSIQDAAEDESGEAVVTYLARTTATREVARKSSAEGGEGA